MILHLLTDEKFSDYVVTQFSDKQLCSEFALVTSKKKCFYFHYQNEIKTFNPDAKSDLQELLIICNKYNAVVFHGLFYPWQEWLLCNLNSNVKKAWVFFGGEIYGQSELIHTFLLPISRFFNKLHRLKCSKNSYVFPKRKINNMDYCLTSVREEYEFAKDYLSSDFVWLWYTYYTIEEVLGTLIDKRCSGNSIWIGNSATIENNFFDILFRLKRLGINDRKIIIPLSYGVQWVSNYTQKVGKFLFGTKIMPLLTFLPREKYNAKMLSCSVMIQPHLRPQAHGNVLTGLWLGMRVYLCEAGIEYKFLKRIGLVLFSIEKDLVSNNSNKYSLLSDVEIEHNRRILLQYYGKNNITKKIQEISKVLND